MKKNKFQTIIDYGSTNLRLGVFDEKLNCFYCSSKNILNENNQEECTKSINLLIKEAEKKISNHIENIIVLYDEPGIFSIDLSIKKEFDQKILLEDGLTSLFSDAYKLINNSYTDKNIIHFIKTNVIIDGKESYKKITKNIYAKTIITEIKFICIADKEYNKIVNIFKKSNLKILNFYFSSYVKSTSYINSFNQNKCTVFLDIGWEKSSLTFFVNKNLKYINNISIGGNHITKDISNVLKIDLKESELIKKAFNESEVEFSYNERINNENQNLIKKIVGKNVSIDLLKKVVLARIEEIIDLSFKDIKSVKDLNLISDSVIVLTGNGSKILNKNSFHLNDKYNFKEISFYEEAAIDICKAGMIFNMNNQLELAEKGRKKQGFFEKFFHFFTR